MFERFTDRARRAVVLAQEESRLLNHDYIGTEHLLVGIIFENEGVAADALKSLGLTHESIHEQIENIIGPGDMPAPTGHIPMTPRAKKVLEFSLREASQLGHNYIGTEHILLSLIREGEGVAAQILSKKVDGGLTEVRNAVIHQLSLYRAKPPEPDIPGTITIRFSPEALQLLWDAEEKARGEKVTVRHIMLALLADNGPLDRMMRTTGEVDE